ncbi:hypothetical protein AYL99_00177 [Fonsecaea erecta]|uniref:Major facilitator superfamily (MFS) profile domain-containing protein n=1 Tax=Fonsecaea erecta TaxID=1367422 RepID=A0A178ZYV6_9EURO|nr:hypothetical protein AYL99_00177 [Fonsecaea erecta]OAP64205.1 hypothetical protein AYL99_00177 [Fonsecaea erecta]
MAPREKISPRNWLIFATLCFGAIAGAMSNGIISTTLGQPSFLEYFGFLNLTGTDTSLIGATLGVFYAGCLFGLHCQDYMSYKYGRRMSLVVASATSIVSGGLIAGSVHIAMFLVFRFFAGFGASMFVATTPLLMSELSAPRHRGLMVGMFGVGLSFGYSVASWFGVAFYFLPASGAQWRIPYALTTVPSILTLTLLPWIPESPRWLIMVDRLDEASRIIRSLHGSGRDPQLDSFANAEFEQMKTQIAFERQNKVTWLQFLTSKRYRSRVWTAALTFMASQSAGILVVINYSTAITKNLGFGPAAQLSITSAYLSSGLVAVCIGALIVDRLGRLKSIIIGTLLQVTVLACLTGIIAKYAGSSNKAANSAAIALFFLYFLGALYAFETVGWRYYLVFLLVPLVVVAALAVLGKETKGKTLEEIGALFGDELVVRTLDDQLETNKVVDTESVHVEKVSPKVLEQDQVAKTC